MSEVKPFWEHGKRQLRVIRCDELRMRPDGDLVGIEIEDPKKAVGFRKLVYMEPGDALRLAAELVREATDVAL